MKPKHYILTLLALFASITANAYDAKIDGIYYNFNGDEAEVTSNSSYSGSVVIPESVIYNDKTYRVTIIGDRAFYNCSGLTSVTIPNSVTSIGKHAFSYCSGLTFITIGNSVTSIGYEAFYGCTSLQYNEYKDVYYLGNNENPYLVLIRRKTTDITTCEINGGCRVIYNYAFSSCSGLTSVSIPNSVISIGDEAFEECSGLTSVSIPNSVTRIGKAVFLFCSSLTSVTIPNSVTGIGDTAFKGCTGLTSVTIGNSVASIGDYAFEECSRLTSVTIGNSVASIGDYAFYECGGLTSVTIPNSVTSIGNHAFSYCSGLTSITIGNSVTSIGSYAFSYCSGLTSIIIPNSVTSIGSCAFEDCSGLTSIIIPNSVTNIDDWAFYGCYFTADSFINNSTLTSSGNWGATLYDGETSDGLLINDLSVIHCRPWATSVTIPNSVTSIGESAFNGCSSLTSVTIPNSVTSIGELAFAGCSGLTSVTIPNSVTSIDYQAFLNCYFTADSFINNSTLTNFFNWGATLYDGEEMSDGLIISNNTVVKCRPWATSVTIPNSVTSIDEDAFDGCSGLTSVTIPNSVTSIGDSAFSGCTGLTSITIPNSVTSIGDSAFSGCTGLTSITIPNSVTSIGESAFEWCGLTSVTSYIQDPFETGLDAFLGIWDYATLYVLAGTESEYRNLDDWSRFTNIVAIEEGEDPSYTVSPSGWTDVPALNVTHGTRTYHGGLLQAKATVSGHTATFTLKTNDGSLFQNKGYIVVHSGSYDGTIVKSNVSYEAGVLNPTVDVDLDFTSGRRKYVIVIKSGDFFYYTTPITISANGSSSDADLVIAGGSYFNTSILTTGKPFPFNIEIKNNGSESWSGSFYLKCGKEEWLRWDDITIDAGATKALLTKSYTPQTAGRKTLTFYYQTSGLESDQEVDGGNLDNPFTITVGNPPSANKLPMPDKNTFAAINPTETSFIASWGAVEGALYYDINVWKVGDDYASSVFYDSRATTSVKVTGLSSGTSYQFRIRARNGNVSQNSDWSADLPTAITTKKKGTEPANISIFAVKGFDGTKPLTVGTCETYRVDVVNNGTSDWKGSFYLKEGDKELHHWHKITLTTGKAKGVQPLEFNYIPESTGTKTLTLYYQTNNSDDNLPVNAGNGTNPLTIQVKEETPQTEETNDIRLIANMTYPKSITLGETGVIEAKVKNFGNKTWTGTLHLSLNGQQPFWTETINALAPEETYTLSHIWKPNQPGKYMLILYQKKENEVASYVESNGFDHPVDVTIINPYPIDKVSINNITKAVTPEIVPAGAEVYYHFRMTDMAERPLEGLKICFNRRITKADGTIEERSPLETDFSDQNGIISFALITGSLTATNIPHVCSGETIELSVQEVITKYNVGVPTVYSPTPIELTVKEDGFLSDFKQFKFEFEPGFSLNAGLISAPTNTADDNDIVSVGGGLHVPVGLTLNKGDDGNINDFSLEVGSKASYEASINAFDWYEVGGGGDVGCNAKLTYPLDDRKARIDAIVRSCQALASDDNPMSQTGAKVLGSWWGRKLLALADFKPSTTFYYSRYAEAGIGVSDKFPEKMSSLMKSIKLPSSFKLDLVNSMEISGKGTFKWEPYKQKRDSNNRDIWGEGRSLKVELNNLLLPGIQSAFFTNKSWWQCANIDQYYQQLLELDIFSLATNTKNKGSFTINEEEFYEDDDKQNLCEIANKFDMTAEKSIDIKNLNIVNKFLPSKTKAKASISSTLSSKLSSKGSFAWFLQNAQQSDKKIVGKIYPALQGTGIIGAPKAHYNVFKEDYVKNFSQLLISHPENYPLREDPLKLEMQVKSKAAAELSIPIDAGFILNFNLDLKFALECECYPSQSYYSFKDKRFFPIVLQPAFTITGAVSGLTKKLAEKLGMSFEEDDKKEIDKEFNDLTHYGVGYVVSEPIYVATDPTHLSLDYSNYYYALAKRRHPRLAEKKQSDICSLSFAINEDVKNFEEGVKIETRNFYHAGDLFGRTELGDTLFVVSEVFDLAATQGTDALKTTQQGMMRLETTVGVDDLTPFGFPEDTPLDVYYTEKGNNIWHYVGPAGTTIMTDKLGAYMMATSIKNDVVVPEILADLDEKAGIIHINVNENIGLRVNTLNVLINGKRRDVTAISESSFEVYLSEEDMQYMLTLYITINDLAGNQGSLFQIFNLDKANGINTVETKDDKTVIYLSKNVLKVEDAEPDATIMLFSIKGDVIAKDKTDNSGKAQVRLNHLPSGVYIVTLSNGKAKKFLIK